MRDKSSWRLQDTANVFLGMLIGIFSKQDRDPATIEIMVLVACAVAFVWTMTWFIVLPAREWWRERPPRRRHRQTVWQRLELWLNIGVLHISHQGRALCGRRLTSAQRQAMRVWDTTCKDCKHLWLIDSQLLRERDRGKDDVHPMDSSSLTTIKPPR